MRNFTISTFFNQLTAMPKRLAMVLTVLFTLGVGQALGTTWTWNSASGDFGKDPGTTTGTVTLNEKSWNYLRDQAGYLGWGNTSIQFGSKNNPENVTLSTSAFSSYTITNISVKASSYDGAHKLTIKVGGETVKSATSLPKPTENPTATSTGTISKKGDITLEFSNKNRALYIQSITITYEEAPAWKLKGDWDSWAEHAMTVNGTEASCKVTLAAGKRYEFGFDGNGAFYKNNGVIIVPISGWVFNTSDGNCKLHTGPAGEYTFKINTSNKQVTVIYPEVTHPHQNYVYFKNSDVWGTVKGYLGNTGNSNKASEWPGIDMPTTTICGETYHYGALSDCGGLYNVIIFNNGNSGYGNQTSDLTVSGSGGKYNANRDANWHDFTTYTITFKGNGNTGGSMTNVSGIPCEGSITLATNGYTRTGYTFNNWKTNVAVTANSSSVAANGIVANKATISNITSDITLTAQWKANTYTITLNGNNGSGHTASVTATYNSATLSPSTITNPTRAGYTFGGWYSASGGTGSMVIGTDGKLQANV